MLRSPVVGVCALALVLAACAGGDVSSDSDAADGTGPDASGGRSDATPLPIADAGPDAGPKRGFGEPCTDKSQCESDICIFVGIGGICTELCVGGSCPGTGEYGCFGVLGVIEPGVVADVCVPLSDQLCTPCVDSSECSLIGMDLCLEYPDGKKFCSQDCSSVECPGGYTCETVNIDGTDYDQCVPASTACDCDATTMDDTEACTISTDFGPCMGTRTCLGATGWGACEAPSPTDTPDGSFTDDNCDGIDGDLTKAIFVAETVGADTATCGLVYSDPCASISHGIIRAITESRGEVYVQAGSYNEVVVMLTGIDVYGGYDDMWQRDDRSIPAHRVTITGGIDSGTGGDSEYLTIRAHDLVVPTTIADVVIVGPTAIGSIGMSARGSYAVHVDNANLVLERVTIQGGDGAGGLTGPTGGNAPTLGATGAMSGANGGNADEFTTACNTTSHGAGGSRGDNTCSGGSVNPDGGNGGNGGEMDTCCSLGTCTLCNCDATNGDPGANASYSPGTSGDGGSGGAASSCGAGNPGNSGRITNGAGGGSAGAGGFLSGGYWYAEFGSNGGVGDHGGGGGGGGGSGGCDAGIDSYGAGGGGGGAGGCRALGGGGGGGGGGGSFGIFAVSATVSASDCEITRGNGGDGGTGGTGGRGQSGGGNGNGGLASGDSKAGGNGGPGAHGGHGGGGGGGAGGIAAGVYSYSSTVTHSCTISGGSRGDGGSGGASAPTAPAAERDGNNGSTGANGSLITTGTCSSPSGC